MPLSDTLFWPEHETSSSPMQFVLNELMHRLLRSCSRSGGAKSKALANRNALGLAQAQAVGDSEVGPGSVTRSRHRDWNGDPSADRLCDGRLSGVISRTALR